MSSSWIHLVLLTIMLVPQRSRSCSIVYCLLANDHQRTWLLLHSRPAPLHPTERDRLYFHACRILLVGQEAHTRTVYPRRLPRGNRRVCHAHCDEDARNPVRREHRCCGRSPAECRDASSMDGWQLRWRSEAGGCDWNRHRVWEPRRVSFWPNCD